MSFICYTPKKFSATSHSMIGQANEILDIYAGQGFDLTLRQLYYQFVSRSLIRNEDSEYKRLGRIVNDARMAGLIDWDRIVDRTRRVKPLPSWRSPMDVIEQVARQYHEPLWDTQPHRVEVWIEKDALVGVIEGICEELDVPYLSCRGYTSQSEMWRASQRLGGYLGDGQKVTIIHLGDHDPSGIDMTRDIEERLYVFMAIDLARAISQDEADDGEEYVPQEIVDRAFAQVRAGFTVNRIALTMEQITHYNPPPNPAKLTDSRGSGYVERFGYESWELDALEPSVMADLIRGAVDDVLDHSAFDDAIAKQEESRAGLTVAAARWHDVVAFLEQDERR
jgi:hypothetical protein